MFTTKTKILILIAELMLCCGHGYAQEYGKYTDRDHKPVNERFIKATKNPQEACYRVERILKPQQMMIDGAMRNSTASYSGSGTAISPFHILTCAHVVTEDNNEPTADLVVSKQEKGFQWKVKVIAVKNDPEAGYDLALLELIDKRNYFDFIPIEKEDEVRIENGVVGLMGYGCRDQKGTDQFFIRGGHIVNNPYLTPITILDAPSREGDSGGGVFDSNGKLIAVIWGSDDPQHRIKAKRVSLKLKDGNDSQVEDTRPRNMGAHAVPLTGLLTWVRERTVQQATPYGTFQTHTYRVFQLFGTPPQPAPATRYAGPSNQTMVPAQQYQQQQYPYRPAQPIVNPPPVQYQVQPVYPNGVPNATTNLPPVAGTLPAASQGPPPPPAAQPATIPPPAVTPAPAPSPTTGSSVGKSGDVVQTGRFFGGWGGGQQQSNCPPGGCGQGQYQEQPQQQYYNQPQQTQVYSGGERYTDGQDVAPPLAPIPAPQVTQPAKTKAATSPLTPIVATPITDIGPPMNKPVKEPKPATQAQPTPAAQACKCDNDNTNKRLTSIESKIDKLVSTGKQPSLIPIPIPVPGPTPPQPKPVAAKPNPKGDTKNPTMIYVTAVGMPHCEETDAVVKSVLKKSYNLRVVKLSPTDIGSIRDVPRLNVFPDNKQFLGSDDVIAYLSTLQ